MRRYLVLGASGLLGFNLSLFLSEKEDVFGTYYHKNLQNLPFHSQRVDLTRPGEARRVIEIVKPQVIINCAALADIDACEKNEALACRLNAQLPGELAEATSKTDMRLIHISTDAVFDGKRGMYTEDDESMPINVYAQTKLAGERAVARGNAAAIIARVNFFGWSLEGRRSLAEWIYNNLSQGKSINGFTDVMFCPLHVRHLCELLVKMTDAPLNGLFHVVSRQCLSKYDFACRLANCFGFDTELIQPSSWMSAGLTAVRAPNLSLRTDKLSGALGFSPQGIDEGLQLFYQQYQQGYPQKIREYVS